MKARIIVWIVSIIVLVGFVVIPQYNEKRKEVDAQKQELTISCNLQNTNRISNILDSFFNKNDELKEKYRFKMMNFSEEGNFDVIISTDKSQLADSNDYSILAYTPLITIVDKKDFNKYIDSGLINHISEDGFSINFDQIITAVISEENWSSFGGDDVPITVFYPAENTVEGKLFEEFLLHTLENSYPEEIQSGELSKKVEAFFASPYTHRVNNASENISYSSVDNAIYCIFESDFIELEIYKGTFTVAYPTTTILRNVYFQNKSSVKKINEFPYWENNSIFTTYQNISDILKENEYRIYNNGYIENPKNNIQKYLNVKTF